MTQDIVLTPFSPVEPHILEITHKGVNIGGTVITKVEGDSLVITELEVEDMGVVDREFLQSLVGVLEDLARSEGLSRLKIEYLPRHAKLYEMAGFTQSYEEGEAGGVVVKHIGSNPAPTGTCYPDAWRYVMRHADESPVLVHGTAVTLSGRIGHAWVELQDGTVWEPASEAIFTKEKFFSLVQGIGENRFTVEEAA